MLSLEKKVEIQYPEPVFPHRNNWVKQQTGGPFSRRHVYSQAPTLPTSRLTAGPLTLSARWSDPCRLSPAISFLLAIPFLLFSLSPAHSLLSSLLHSPLVLRSLCFHLPIPASCAHGPFCSPPSSVLPVFFL